VICLVDVNLLFAIHQPAHPDFAPATRWFMGTGKRSFATCPITQAGLLRLLTQGVADAQVFSFQEAREALAHLMRLPGHSYWQDQPDFLTATAKFYSRLQGHRQITDAYLLGLAIHYRGKLATLDRGILQLAGSDFADHVELIGSAKMRTSRTRAN
jgi:uncharacterized protein